jgi:hypothetical protein
VSPCSSEARAVWSRALERSERDVGLYSSDRVGGQRCWTMKVTRISNKEHSGGFLEDMRGKLGQLSRRDFKEPLTGWRSWTKRSYNNVNTAFIPSPLFLQGPRPIIFSLLDVHETIPRLD